MYHKHNKIRGAEPVSLLLILVLLGSTQLVPNWRVSNIFSRKDKAKIEQLVKQLEEQEKVRAAEEAARIALEKQQADERAKLEAQVQGAQQMNAGTLATLRTIPSEAQTRQTRLALSFAIRADARLTQAIGRLPDAQQAEIAQIVADLLSDAEARVESAEARLRAKDEEAKAITAQRDELRFVAIPAAKEAVLKAEADKAKVEAKVGELTNQVAKKAAEYEEKDREAGSLYALLRKLAFVLVLLVFGWVFFALILPGFVKTLNEGRLKTILRSIAGHTTAPILYRDASKKLKERSKEDQT
jgi:hypothetical protein